MKHLNFLSKSSSRSCGHSSVTLALTVGSPSAHRRGTMLKHVAFLLLFLFAGFGQMWGALTNSYTKVTSVTDLADGDVVVLATESSSLPSVGVSGQNGTNDAAVSTTESEWVQYEITLVKSGQTITGWTLYNPTLEKYVQSPTGNHFKHGTTGGTCYVKTESGNGQYTFACNSRYLQKNSSYYRMYGSINTSYTMFYVWKVASSCSNKVTLSKGTESNGTFSLNKSNGAYDNCGANFVVTVSSISASSGYYCTGVTATGGNSSVTGPDGSGNYTVTYTKGNNITSTITANFAAKTARTVTFMNNGVQYGDVRNLYDGDAVGALPSDPSSCATGKIFVGWSETEIGVTPTDVEPTFITASTIVSGSNKVYHAVFATATQGEDEVLSQTLLYDTWSYSGTTSDQTTYRLFGNNAYVESASFDLSILSKVIVYGGTYGGDSYNSLTIGDGTNTWKSVTVSGKSATGTNTYTGGTALSGTGSLRIKSNSGNGSSTGVRISQVKIYTIPYEYSGYITGCCSPLGQINGSFF